MKLYIEIADKHLQAAKENNWDYPTGSYISDIVRIKELLREGKTLEDVYLQCIASFGTITGAVLNSHFGHVSKSTEQAVRKGMKKLIG